jgi:NAD(P)-dependent dehydrogenase (short-subunit alcohol dehydrogenase family)
MTPGRPRPPLDEQVVVITGASQGIGRELELHPMRKRLIAAHAIVAGLVLVRKVGT